MTTRSLLTVVLTLLALAMVAATRAEGEGLKEYTPEVPSLPEKAKSEDHEAAPGQQAKRQSGDDGPGAEAGAVEGSEGSPEESAAPPSEPGGGNHPGPGEGGSGGRPKAGDGSTSTGLAAIGDNVAVAAARTPGTTAAVEGSSSSSPVIPILIAVAVLAAISIGTVVYRHRRGASGSASPKTD